MRAQGLTFLGLYGARRLEGGAQVADPTTAVDVLGSMAVLLPGLSLGNVLLGRSWMKLRREIEMRADISTKYGASIKLDLPASFLSAVPATREAHRMIRVKPMGIEPPKRPHIFLQAKKKSRSKDADEPWDNTFSDLAATLLTRTRMFLAGIRNLRGRSSLTTSHNLEGPFAMIHSSVRLGSALQIADTLLTEEFNAFQRISAFSAMVRHLTPQEQLDFASQLYDKFLVLEQIRSDEVHAKQYTAFFGDLHPENFLPFISNIQKRLQNDGSSTFAQACLRCLASSGGSKA